MAWISVGLATLHILQAAPASDERARYDRAVECAGILSATALLREAMGDAAAADARDKANGLVSFAYGRSKQLAVPTSDYFAALESAAQTAVRPLGGVEDPHAVRATLTRMEPAIAGCEAFGAELAAQLAASGTS